MELQVFNSTEFGSVRTATVKGEVGGECEEVIELLLCLMRISQHKKAECMETGPLVRSKNSR